MRLIPGKTKVKIELFKGVNLGDILVGAIGLIFIIFMITSSLPGRYIIAFGLLILFAALIVRLDGEPNYLYVLNILRHFGYKRKFARVIKDKDLVEREVTEEDVQENIDALAEDLKETEAERKQREKEEDAILKSATASEEEKEAIRMERRRRYAISAQKVAAAKEERMKRDAMDQIIPFTDIRDGFICYAGQYYGAAIEIPPVEFRFMSQHRRDNSIENGLGRSLRIIHSEYSANIVKIERPIIYDKYLANEYSKLDELKTSYENGMIKEEEMKTRVEVIYNRIEELKELCFGKKVVQPFYYLVFYDSDRNQLNNTIGSVLDNLRGGEMDCHRLDDKELAVFLKYSNAIDFDEREIDHLDPDKYVQWAMPEVVDITPRTVQVNHIITHNFRVVGYPSSVDDAWMATVMSMPGTKVVMKCKPMDRSKAVKGIDSSLAELRGQWMNTSIDSKQLELQSHIETLSSLLALLQGDNETLLEVNIYITAYDIYATRNNYSMLQPPESSLAVISNMKRVVRRTYQENSIRVNNMEFNQTLAFIGAQISGYDPMSKEGRGIPSNTVAAAYPWVFKHVSDPKGIKLGESDGVPVFIDFFRRDSERVNSNMVIVGKSGSGKSYATKSLLTNLAADNSKIFILDPENEYTELAKNLHGKFINVGNAQYGRLNPFQIITALDDEDEKEGESGSYATHLQFLEEFFRQILPDCEKDAMEYLNSMIDRMYTNMGITSETDLSKLKPEDYPIFDDLYDAILSEFQSTDNDYIRSMLRTLMNYVAKFSTGGRNANIWNGPSTVTTEENFTVFNFQSLLANRNGSIANAQMLLVLKYIDNEIIKNRDYNTRYHLNRKVIVVIDEAHVFIDTKFPVALDFMFQLAKRIRKYNGMQIVITQNIKDFVGSEEISRKSTAIINACQYSFIFSLAPNDMDDLCKLYEKAGGINENEQEQIVQAGRGQAFTVMSPQSRSSFKVVVPPTMVEMFQEENFQSHYFSGEGGEENWEETIAESRAKREEHGLNVAVEEVIQNVEEQKTKRHITFTEISEEDAASALRPKSESKKKKLFEEIDDFDDFNIPEIPDDPAEFEKMKAAKAASAAAVPSMPVPQVVQQPIVVQAPSSSGELEAMVSQLGKMVENMSKFSYEAMKSEMERMLKDSTPAPAPASSSALGSIFNEDAMAEAARLNAEESEAAEDIGMTDEEEMPADIDLESSFDFYEMLASAAGDDDDASSIDMMITYDETIMEITLEELAKYNK